MVVTLRNLPPEVATRLQQIARRNKMSLNKTVVRLLEERLGVVESAALAHDDLDWFIGCWTKRRAEEFDRALAGQRAIEVDAWK